MSMTNPSKLIDRLESLRDDWIEEIPSHDVSGGNPYKCRNAWYSSIDSAIRQMDNAGLLFPVLASMRLSYWIHCRQTDFPRRPKTVHDIAIGNALIRQAIHSLKRSE